MAREDSDGDSSSEGIEVETEHIETPADVEPAVDVDAVEVNDPVNERIAAEALKPPAKARRAALPYDGDDSEREEPESQDPFLQADANDPPEFGEAGEPDESDDAGSEAVEVDGGHVYPVHCGDRRSYDETEPVHPVTTGESVTSLYGRVVRVEDAGRDWSDDRELYLADATGTTRVRLHGQLDSPELLAGEHVVVTDVENDGEEGSAKFEQTADSDVVAIGQNRQTPGFWMRERSRLIKAEAWYSDEHNDDWEAEETVKNTILNEYHIETPRGQDDVMVMYVDAPGSENHGTWTQNGEDRIKELLEEHLPEWKTNDRTKNSVVSSLIDRTRVPDDAWDEGTPDDEGLQWSIGVQNGVIDLSTGEMHDHGPEWRVRRKLPVEYNPEQYDGLGDGVQWFIDETMKTDGDRESFKFMLGHALARCYPTETVWALIGPGGNGKTLLLEVIQQLLGGVSGSFDLDIMTGDSDFGGGPLVGSNLVIDDDATDVKMQKTGLMKKASGGSEAMVNKKYDQMTGDGYDNYATMVYLANDPPMFSDKTRGMERRIYPVLMPYEFTNDPSDDKKNKIPRREIRDRTQTTEELEALLVVAVQYAQKLHRGDDVKDGRTEEDRWTVYEKYSDNILRFWKECTVAEQGARVTRNAVYEIYVQWCDHRGVDPKSTGGRNGFWPLSDQCHGVSYNRDSVHLDGERAIEHVTLAPEALEYAPEWVADKWEADIDEEETTLANRLDRATPLADLDGGYCTVETRVIARSYADAREESGVKITLEDDTTAIDAITWDGEFDGVDVGDKVRLERAVLTQHRSVPQLRLAGPTSVNIVERGPLADVAGEDAIAADGGDETGGESGDSDRSMDLINDDIVSKETSVQSIEDVLTTTIDHMDGDDDPAGEAVIGRVVSNHDFNKEKVEHAAEKLKHCGDIYEPADGHWRCT